MNDTRRSTPDKASPPPQILVTLNTDNGVSLRLRLPANADRPGEIIENLVRRAVNEMYKQELAHQQPQEPVWATQSESNLMIADLGLHVADHDSLVKAVCEGINHLLDQAGSRIRAHAT